MLSFADGKSYPPYHQKGKPMNVQKVNCFSVFGPEGEIKEGIRIIEAVNDIVLGPCWKDRIPGVLNNSVFLGLGRRKQVPQTVHRNGVKWLISALFREVIDSPGSSYERLIGKMVKRQNPSLTDPIFVRINTMSLEHNQWHARSGGIESPKPRTVAVFHGYKPVYWTDGVVMLNPGNVVIVAPNSFELEKRNYAIVYKPSIGPVIER